MTLVLKKEPNLAAKREAFTYQREAVEAIRDREYAAVFHEQGLGKSKIAIDVILYWLERKAVDTILLVVKKGLVANWQRELQAHTHLSPRVLTGDRKANYYVLNSPARLILTHYEAVRSERKRLALFLRTRDVAAILDEATKIKNPESEIAKVFLELAPQFKRRIIMTGTPVANRPYDLWAQIRFLDGGKSLGDDFASFERKHNLSNLLAHDSEGRAQFEQNLGYLHQKIADFSVRATKDGKVIQLPAKVVRRIDTDWEPRQLDLYTQIKDDLRAIVVRDGIPTEDDAEDQLKRLLRLVQICSNPALVDESYTVNPGKWEPLEALIDEIGAANEKCIVWTTFTENADWLAFRLRATNPAKIHGKLSMDQRNRAVEVFIGDPDCRVLVATPGAAKEGLTLTVANHVIFFDRGFSLDDYLQAQDRIHRVSQEKTCYVYNLIMRDSIDEWVDELLEAKRLAAQLAQGDISLEYYQSQMSYSYGEIIRQILGVENPERA